MSEKIQQAIKTLRHHNKWRRGDETLDMGCVKELGQAIDLLTDLADKLMQEPSKGMREDACLCIDEALENSRLAEVDEVFKSMRDQMIKEIK